MKYLIPNFVSKAEAQDYTKHKEVIRTRVLRAIAKLFKEDYARLVKSNRTTHVSARATGHPWHFDGCRLRDGPYVDDADADHVYGQELIDNHMGWCRYGASILLTPPDTFKGGEFQYMERDGTRTTVKDKHYLALAVHTGHLTNDPELHRVLPSSGERRLAFLVFC
jgi:hypothetical protein